ncbi:hypothetical protein GALMADRAFT_1292050 [Galerina marginata CBS 339.88]|uniref:Uncharacterized protein n=1 Tax=Galerina marginata (strain CBS 339.88) TaxID=685588 RepID=A0A067SC45_GALM3|nr:hypothetical protein GALMADRAFT_1292050 [Galerina marginata CBS 339.88]
MPPAASEDEVDDSDAVSVSDTESEHEDGEADSVSDTESEHEDDDVNVFQVKIMWCMHPFDSRPNVGSGILQASQLKVLRN